MGNLAKMKRQVNNLIQLCIGLAALEILQKVNGFVNKHIEFIPDWKLYKVKDYWAAPSETMKHMAGDCEDIAILKYWILVRLGLKPVFYYTHIRMTGEAHIVCVCNGYVLDTFKVNPMVRPKHERNDLAFGHSFNSKQLWAKGKAYRMADVNMSKFKGMLGRMTA